MNSMKKFLLIFVTAFLFFAFNDENVEAKQLIATDNVSDISGNPVGIIEIYDDSRIKISYKYGLRLAELHYCNVENDCDMNIYSYLKIAEATESNSYKNEKSTLEHIEYKPILEDGKEYKFKVKAYFGSRESYTGKEDPSTAFGLVILEVDSKNSVIQGSSTIDVADENLSGLMEDLKYIVNKIALPIIYISLGLILIIKGAILGVQIVKSADDPNLRREKVGALKWLLIGVVVAMTASTLVGVLTGFFQDLL